MMLGAVIIGGIVFSLGVLVMRAFPKRKSRDR
jgi:hypothetical protein